MTPSDASYDILGTLKSKLNPEHLEYLYLAVAFCTLLYLSLGSILDNQLTHPAPTGYFAKDAYWHEAYNEHLYDKGFYNETPSFLVGGIEGLAPIQPPLLYYLVSSIASLLKIPVYDANSLFLGLIMVLSCFIAYFIIRRVHVHLAMLSLPITALLFSFPFYAGFTFGEHLFVLGMFFLLLSIYLLLGELCWTKAVLLGFSIAALILAHTVEFIYFGLIFAAVSFFKLLQQRWKDMQKMAASLCIGLLLSFDYLVIFKNTWLTTPGDPIAFKHLVSTDNFGQATVFAHHFGWLWWIIVAGVVLSIYFLIINKSRELQAAFLILFAISMGTYLNQFRSYQFRFFWPLVVSYFFGLSLYILLQQVSGRSEKLKQNALLSSVVYVCIALLILLGISAQIQPSQSGSVVTPNYWESIIFIEQQMQQGQSVLFVDPLMSQEKVLWRLKKATPHLAMRHALLSKVQEGNFSEDIQVNIICEGAQWRRDSYFTFSKSAVYAQECRVQDKSVCSYDYVFLNLQGLPKEYLEYWQKMLSQDGFSILQNSKGIVIVHNSKPAGRCAHE